MTSLSFNDFYFFLNPVWFLSGLWIFFFKMNSNFNKISSEKSSHINIIKINSNKTFIGFYYYLIFFNIMYIYTLHGKNLLLWFSHFNVNNFTISLLYFFLLVSFTIYFLLNSLTKKSNVMSLLIYIIVCSAVFSGGAGGARAPPVFGGSGKGRSLISAFRTPPDLKS